MSGVVEKWGGVDEWEVMCELLTGQVVMMVISRANGDDDN